MLLSIFTLVYMHNFKHEFHAEGSSNAGGLMPRMFYHTPKDMHLNTAL